MRKFKDIINEKLLEKALEENKALRERLNSTEEKLKGLEWEMQAIQSLFANENDDCLVEPFNSENLFKWLNKNDIEQQINVLTSFANYAKGKYWNDDKVQEVMKWAVEQLHKEIEDLN